MEDAVFVVSDVGVVPVLNNEELAQMNGKSLEFIHGFVDHLVSCLRKQEQNWHEHDELADMTLWLIEAKDLDLSQSSTEEIRSLAQEHGYKKDQQNVFC